MQGASLPRVSLKVLSDHLGLTQGTVSRALNNYPDISEKTRRRVRHAAGELGYRANPAARRLATGVAEAVAYVMPSSRTMSEPFVAQLLTGLGEALAGRGWDLLVTHCATAAEEAAMINRLVTSGQVAGVIDELLSCEALVNNIVSEAQQRLSLLALRTERN